MKIIRVHPFYPDPQVLSYAVDVLRNGGVVVHPTDTCYGLAVDIANQEAVKRLFAIKKMSEDKPVSIIIHDKAALEQLVHLNELAVSLIEKHWPGPLTVVLQRKSGLPEYFNKGHETVGIRHPECNYSLSLVKGLGSFISTTSANLSGGQNPYSLDDILREFGERELKPDLILDAGELPKVSPSTIVSLVNGSCKILRQGDLKIEIL